MTTHENIHRKRRRTYLEYVRSYSACFFLLFTEYVYIYIFISTALHCTAPEKMDQNKQCLSCADMEIFLFQHLTELISPLLKANDSFLVT